MDWFYSKNGTQQGPVSLDELMRKKQSGEVLPTDLVWKQGMPDWKPLSQVAELGGGTTPSVPSYVPNAPSPYSQNPTASYAPSGIPGSVPNIPNYLWQSIAVTLLCCIPFGVVAIVYATKVDGLVARGDIAGAMDASKSARMWVNISAGVSILMYIVIILLSVVSEVASH